ncbi:hypothetical protein [Paucibacter sp. M5-1]|uniref:hypothetical protein n=1 Tax=Paucibacter sp. M5-1 TaxID=3015998 RepID=UPI0022B8D4C2|nr:hypothetical protein [Paucibacter sp. M5-1]MCZ7884100.1 hypothetical protein [Paucibacter sp. M5-1]
MSLLMRSARSLLDLQQPVLGGSSPTAWPITRPAPAICSPSFDPSSLLWRLQKLFHETGGLVNTEELLAPLRDRYDQPLSVLARWIVDRRVVSFEARGERWLPLFQFDTDLLVVLCGVEHAIRELHDVFDDGELAEWFATSNGWLQNASPAAMVSIDPAAVINAARADRYVATC